jgi:hypothetical protein
MLQAFAGMGRDYRFSLAGGPPWGLEYVDPIEQSGPTPTVATFAPSESISMPNDPREQRSVTFWLAGLRGEVRDEPLGRLWGRYFDRPVHLARARLRAAPRGQANEKDAAVSAFDSSCRRAAKGRFPRLGGRDDLWRLLVSITVRKAQAVAQHERRLKRSGRVDGEAALDDDLHRRVAVVPMEGHTNDEAAERLGCGLLSVGRKLSLIVKTWEREPI